MSLRRVVTGRAADGKSVFVSDEQVEPITVTALPSTEFYQLWGSNTPVVLPVDGRPTQTTSWFPPERGFRFAMVTFPPETAAPVGALDEAALTEVEAKLPGLVEVVELEHPGMHTTNTVDFGVIVSGELWLELDDDMEVQLRAGDCVVQNGTRHAWHNKSSAPCVVAFALIGAARAT